MSLVGIFCRLLAQSNATAASLTDQGQYADRAILPKLKIGDTVVWRKALGVAVSCARRRLDVTCDAGQSGDDREKLGRAFGDTKCSSRTTVIREPPDTTSLFFSFYNLQSGVWSQ